MSNAPAWLTATVAHAAIKVSSSTLGSATLTIQVNTSGMPELIDPYNSAVEVYIGPRALWEAGVAGWWAAASPLIVRHVTMPVRVLLSALPVAERCTVTAKSPLSLPIGSTFKFSIIARDVEGLPLARSSATFGADVQVWVGEADTPTSIKPPAITFAVGGEYTGAVDVGLFRARANVIFSLVVGSERIPMPDQICFNITCIAAAAIAANTTATTLPILALPTPSLHLPGGVCGCPAGYRPEGVSSTLATLCVPCAAGTTSDGVSNCDLQCPPSTYSEVGWPECLPCPAGRFSAEYRSSACGPCREGYFSPPGSTECAGGKEGLQISLDGVLNGTLPGFWSHLAPLNESNALLQSNLWECNDPQACWSGFRFTPHSSPLTTLTAHHTHRSPHSPLTTLTAHRSPLAARRSPLAARRSLLTTHHSPPTTHHPPLAPHHARLAAGLLGRSQLCLRPRPRRRQVRQMPGLLLSLWGGVRAMRIDRDRPRRPTQLCARPGCFGGDGPSRGVFGGRAARHVHARAKED